MKRNILILNLMGIFLLFFGNLFFSDEKIAKEEEFIGADTCKGCHETQYASYAASIHSKKLVKGPGAKEACETCHGPGAKHVEKGGGRGVNIFDFGKRVMAEARNEKCLICHEEQKGQAFWNITKHKFEGIACNDCHKVHGNSSKLLKSAQNEVCYDCHKDIELQANKQSRHPIKEGKISCADCHNTHGEFGPRMLKADNVNELCYKCHAEKRGPFMFEHPPVEENCMNCHVAHGSNHNKLLTMRMPNLCQSCHDWTRHPGTAYTEEYGFDGTGSAVSRNKLIGRSCLNCHNNIHGGFGVGARGPKFTR